MLPKQTLPMLLQMRLQTDTASVDTTAANSDADAIAKPMQAATTPKLQLPMLLLMYRKADADSNDADAADAVAVRIAMP
jgi:hypothetical protein